MAEPLSIVSGIAGIVTLSGAVVAAGYRYINAVASAPKDVRDVVREVAALSALLSQLVAQSLPPSPSSRYVFDTLVRQNVIQDCEVILRSIQKSLQACTPIDEQTRQNALKALAWPLKQKDIAKNGERINRLCAILRTALSIDNTSTLARIENQQTQVVLSVHDSNERQMLAWLSPISPIEKHVAATTLVQPGTCDWIFREQAFNQWMDEGKFLWVHGASGIGKTVLTARITNRLLDSFQTTSKQYAVAYHYCDFANPLTLDPTHILGSLVKQIAEDMDHFPNQLREIYHKLSGKAPQIEELMVLFRQLVSEISRAAYIIIDGVDECLDRKTLLLAVQGLRQPLSGSSAPKVILFSRPEYDIRQALLNEPTFAILPRHIEDSLETHVRIEIAKIPRLRYLTHSGREELTKTLILRADGMFRWVQCQLDVLKTIRTPHALQKALVTLPDGLNETYDRILTQIHASDQVYVIRALRWLTGTHRPLSVEELAEAIAIDPCKTQLDLEERLIDPEEVLDICGSLLRIEATRIVVLAHYSVKEYLLSDHLVSHSKLALFSMVEQISTQHISTCLLTYMFTIQWRIQQLRNEYLDEKEFALIEYAKHAPAKAYLDYEAAKAWFEGYLLSNSYRYEDLATLISYTKPPAPYEGNYPDAWNVQMCIQVSLLFYWNTMIQRDLAEESHRTESRGILEALFITLQREWYVEQRSYTLKLGSNELKILALPFRTLMVPTTVSMFCLPDQS
ncbi:hypothetical protein CC86DRAFT_416916 [Ophiobolus disseminans]|uniref:Uncharacterized protein n=1 Tax=Ophiobolus disseminans TaxID=1469910 RepID=A0A6A7A1T1_9PLEO|nr:hypothetical protein CC86DRAFT_416916 [Ophiobolus disseminans]